MRGLDGSAPDGILQVDAARRIVEANRSAERMLGYPVGKLAGLPLSVLEPRDSEGRPLLE
ncbi:MAG: PAS domain-containing protein, partial [Acidimicrobiales bacterium]